MDRWYLLEVLKGKQHRWWEPVYRGPDHDKARRLARMMTDDGHSLRPMRLQRGYPTQGYEEWKIIRRWSVLEQHIKRRFKKLFFRRTSMNLGDKAKCAPSHEREHRGI
jgi:hypothetical protein